ncbi:hypothetical protein [Nitrosomonas ureae]|uniref:Uncharacterized protein n=2 Tax=Nitrosomonas ureae TaxID=44577 RepID=A0A1H2E8Z6_9PROT|nr:hypothetical protein [Nitrosomonas ureae]ALQ52016.1 hypothetical protein ATY38_12790 [Nitrosomonas ureae]SDT91504.1 hypothetical protein SAMN05216406_11044 [Nitrosomonas ureae]
MALSENDEIVLCFFTSAKEEVYSRIRLRDTLLAAYTTAVAATFAFAKYSSLGINPSEDTKNALLILPYMGFAFTLLVCYHHLCIATLGAYIKFELRAKLKTVTTVHVFDGWHRFEEHRNGAQRLRTVGQAIILVIPPITALFINYEAAISSEWSQVVYFWFGVAATLVSLATIIQTYINQKQLNGSNERVHERRARSQDQKESQV